MKRKVAKRKLLRRCILCNCGFKKGEVYHVHREVWPEGREIITTEYIMCPRCKYKDEDRNRRFVLFKESCKHPEEFIFSQYQYMCGEAIMEPSHDECRLCGKVV